MGRLLEVFDETYEGASHTYLGCEIERDLLAGTRTLSQRHYAEEILRTYDAFACFPSPPLYLPASRTAPSQVHG